MVFEISVKCPKCKGKGKIRKEKTTCPACYGVGKTSFSLSGKGVEGDICKKCNGTGKITIYEKCPVCDGKKTVFICKNCKNIMKTPSKSGLCPACESQKKPIIYKLRPPIDSQLIRNGMVFLGRVDQIKNFGVFIKLAEDVKVLIRKEDMSDEYAWDLGEEVQIKIKNVSDSGKLYGKSVNIKDYSLLSMRGRVRDVQIKEITHERVGAFLSFKAQVVSILQTSGPTRFTFADATGSINGAAFIKAGERAFPEITEDMVVECFGEVTEFKESLQIEIQDIEALEEKETKKLLNEIEIALDKKATPAELDFTVKSEILSKLKPDIIKAAKRIRKAIFTGQPIYIRHHADADGVVAGFSVQQALIQLMEEEGYDADTIRIRIKRLPNKPPFYDPIDVVKDLDFALADKERFGDKLPLIICLDFGSSMESILPYLQIKALGLEIIVVDHHFPDEEIREIVDLHINPYFVGGGYEISGGMLGYELARFIHPTVITDSMKHLPAIAGLMDRVEGNEIKEYINLAKEKGYSEEDLKTIGIAVDYELYQLKFSEGTNLMKILFGVDTNSEWHKQMFKILGEEAKKLMDNTLKSVLPHVKQKTLENNVILTQIDVELFSHRFTFPNPGKITGMVFDHFVEKNGNKPVVTLGEGPDFLILRSKGLAINFPEVVKLMQEKIPEADVQGGGHEVVGSLKFYEGTRDKVLDFFIKYLAKSSLTL
ncbi:MAG: hypothetical protein K9W46_06330 [Candidatus Heimdallarchaeum endolithica]|uniref:S1 motif domain-containing protein n=1 Tax=Candidatus Heimdallarchaeum endolithica TaxID=2876572 RepID=A0A9Y1BTS0_9ARCH|nr:MAG: hypothetical protein K9W46_06330 [Candidatus Heimdallarchaeum endolithica]